MREIKIFSGRANPKLAEDVCNFLHLKLGRVTLGEFPDGEIQCKIEEEGPPSALFGGAKSARLQQFLSHSQAA
mgnify:CR=1 FL=1